MPKKPMKKILIAEDEKPMAMALELKLKKEGFDAMAVHNGNDAISEIEKGGYDLVLLDLMMAYKDGFTVMTEMKKKGAKVPIIVTSNLSQKVDEKKARELGAVDFLVKSNTPIVKIVERVKEQLSR